VALPTAFFKPPTLLLTDPFNLTIFDFIDFPFGLLRAIFKIGCHDHRPANPAFIQKQQNETGVFLLKTSL
jgi:hypothetical protein